MREKISACILTFNEERKVQRCLQSVTWCDEIVVLDSFSTDRTPEICRSFTDRFHQNVWLGYVGQRNRVRDLASHGWLLFLDADEEVSPPLRDEILAEFERGTGDCVGYEFPRLVYYLNRWIRHGDWYPDIKLRLFQKAHGRAEGEEPHDRIEVRGSTRRLRHPVWHYTYDDIRDQMDTINRFSGITAQQRFVKSLRFRWLDILFRPGFRFFRGYILRAGFLDGPQGFLIAILNAYATFAKYAKIWELQRRQRSDFRELPGPVTRQPPGPGALPQDAPQDDSRTASPKPNQAYGNPTFR
jgi:glycosyltransferase involved in cell wall biosynthesis